VDDEAQCNAVDYEDREREEVHGSERTERYGDDLQGQEGEQHGEYEPRVGVRTLVVRELPAYDDRGHASSRHAGRGESGNCPVVVQV